MKCLSGLCGNLNSTGFNLIYKLNVITLGWLNSDVVFRSIPSSFCPPKHLLSQIGTRIYKFLWELAKCRRRVCVLGWRVPLPGNMSVGSVSGQQWGRGRSLFSRQRLFVTCLWAVGGLSLLNLAVKSLPDVTERHCSHFLPHSHLLLWFS